MLTRPSYCLSHRACQLSGTGLIFLVLYISGWVPQL
jgi:hypothetical protein